ncbi:MAG: cupin domain-containing protein [Candidatus Omnitrophica bacterium]|nr:cupin domain-containing protein [Candidatus Omnitrophota bacterium]
MKTQTEISKEWQKRGFSCDLWVDPPGQVWEDYRHDVDELVYVLEGAIELEVSGKRKTLKAGEEGFIPARANHSVRNIGGTEARWLYGYKTKGKS